jgi:hypothetical protein
MCDILREEKQIKAGTATEGKIKKERRYLVKIEMPSLHIFLRLASKPLQSHR